MKVLSRLTRICLPIIVLGCAGPAPQGAAIDEAVQRSIKITQVSVDVSMIGPASKGRPLSTAQIETAVRKAANDVLIGAGQGDRSARVHIELEAVNIISAGQAFMLGGESVLQARVMIRDLRSGTVLLPPTQVSAGGGGWVPGGLIAVATLEEPEVELRELSQELASRIWTLIEGRAPAAKTTAGGSPGSVAASAPPVTMPTKCTYEHNKDLAHCRVYYQ
ncbi:hypothetical protein OEW28_04515 [Defluviimonas sp. WL0002]|uniref:DUF4410 domain-containing protein n=1 Tax=Albidovulum marisflavi TaxID=2984159 RepID=A0ABT2Z9U2_9RHOB|nr:hypothetical protein [Defluviimonas sp. WL0002]MCV2867882.1 hypothetical protein [Defluviimonas sp. WL0002]